jgi:tetratricopeptide (TPR) repeat protein
MNIVYSQDNNYIKSGYDNLKKGNYEAAIENYSKVIENNKSYAPAYYGRALAKSNSGKFIEAIDDYDLAINLNSRYHEAFYGSALSKIKIGKNEQAYNDIIKAISIDNQNPDYLYTLANLDYGQKHFQKAVDEYSKVIELNPVYSLAYYGRGISFKQIEKLREAEQDLNKYLELSADKDNLGKEAIRLIEEIRSSEN